MLEAPPIPVEEIAASQSSAGLHALLTAAAWAPIQGTAFIRVTGDDRTRWLNGMVTNSIQSLTPGDGCYNFFLSAQGRIQGDATAWMLDDAILLETAADRADSLIALLDRFIIMDDVELQPLPPATGLQFAGPAASVLLSSLSIQVTPATGLHLSRSAFGGAELDLIHAHSPLVPRYETWAAPATIAELTQALAGRTQADVSAIEQLRVLEGTPRYGTDIRDRELPQETAQTRALHFSKGCYLGQEIVERIRSRGNVHRTFSGFILTGNIPPAGTPLFAEEAPEKSIGELTSSALVPLPAGPATLALGYIRREILERGHTVHYDGGTARPITLPFRSELLSPQP